MRTPLEPPGTRRSHPPGREDAEAGGRRVRDAIVDLPAPTVLYLGVTVLLTTVAGWLGWPILRHRGGSVALLVMALMLTLAVWRASRPPRSGHQTEGSWLLLVPSAGVIVALLAAIVAGGVGQDALPLAPLEVGLVLAAGGQDDLDARRAAGHRADGDVVKVGRVDAAFERVGEVL